MIGKTLRIEKSAGHSEWCAKIADALGVTYAWSKLDGAKVAELVQQLNAASEAGAPWGKFEALPRRR